MTHRTLILSLVSILLAGCASAPQRLDPALGVEVPDVWTTADAPAGTIRGDFGMSRRYNLIHGSDSPESARREIPLFFNADELMKDDWPTDQWIYATQDGELI